MKTIFTFLLFLLYFTTFSQVKVGDNPNNVNNSALFEMESTSKGFLPPRMTTAQRDAIQNPASMLIIANTTTNCLEIYIAPNWQNMFCGCSSAPANLSYTDNGPLTYCLNAGISPNIATTQASTPSSFTISPSLPAGLQLNNVNGQITGTPAASASAADYTITASNACGSTTRVLNIGVITIPATPTTISGPSAPSINSSANYSITAVSSATSYTWTVPAGWTIDSGQGTTAINVTVGSNAGNITVTATNSCGTSAASTKAVTSWRPIVATGGTITNYTANGTNGVNGVQYRVHSFTTVGTSSFNVTDAGADGQVDYLVVAGGGGAGSWIGGGGGGGGLIYLSNQTTSLGSYPVVVGQGGTGAVAGSMNGTNGNTSSAFGQTAIGGGRGGSYNGSDASNGGSGGGGTYSKNPGAGTAGQGYGGGSNIIGSGSGGGGAGGPGSNGGIDGDVAGNGGIGLEVSITGTALYYAGGGGGATNLTSPTSGFGGQGGGGNGANGPDPTNGSSATFYGGGGGGGTREGAIGGSGSSGIVIIRYPLSSPNP